MQKRHVTILDPNTGQARPAVFVTVRDSVSLALASLFSDNEVTPLPNPLTTDSAGRVAFKTADGEYDITVSGPGMIPQTIDKVQIADKDGFAKAGGAMVVHAHDSDSQGGKLDAAAVFRDDGGIIPAQHTMTSAVGDARFVSISSTQCALLRGIIPLKVGLKWQMRVITAPLILSNSGLPVDILLYVYAFATGTGTALVASGLPHSQDVEFGVEVASGNPLLTLVGMIRTNVSGLFADGPQFRWVASYFNRRNRSIATGTLAGFNPTTASGSPVVLSSNWNTHFLNWADEAFTCTLTMYAANNTAGCRADSSIGTAIGSGVAAAVSTTAGVTQVAPGGLAHSSTTSLSMMPGEGTCFVTPMGSVSGGGIGTWFDTTQPIMGIVRG